MTDQDDPNLPTHFRCAFHNITRPLGEYDQHCEDQHGGKQIAVYFLRPEESA